MGLEEIFGDLFIGKTVQGSPWDDALQQADSDAAIEGFCRRKFVEISLLCPWGFLGMPGWSQGLPRGSQERAWGSQERHQGSQGRAQGIPGIPGGSRDVRASPGSLSQR